MAFLEGLPSRNPEHFSLISSRVKLTSDSPAYIPTYETTPKQVILSEPSNLLLRYLTQRFESMNTAKRAKRTGPEAAERGQNKRATVPPDNMTF